MPPKSNHKTVAGYCSHAGSSTATRCPNHCNKCEPHVKAKMQLENDLLRKRIELLQRSRKKLCSPPAPVTMLQ